MTAYAALLRGVNVGGRRLAMPELAAALAGLGFEQVGTYLQSGNAVFVAPGTAEAVAGGVESALLDRVGLDIPVLVRSSPELDAVVAANPFLEVERDPTKLHVTFLGEEKDGAAVEPPGGRGRDTFEILGREVFLHCPDGYGRSKLTNGFFERRLGTVATTRNWRTVLALADLARERSATTAGS